MVRFALIFLVVLLACTQVKNPNKSVHVRLDPNEAVSYALGEVADSVFYIPLNESAFPLVGYIPRVKSYGSYLLLDNQQAGSIVALDRHGSFKGELTRKGGGPEEYPSYSSFSLNASGTVLTLSVPGVGFKNYAFPSMKYVSTWPCSRHVIDFEYVSDAEMMLINYESEENSPFELWNGPDAKVIRTISIPVLPSSLLASVQHTLAHSVDRTGIYYARPSNELMIFDMLDGDSLADVTIDAGQAVLSRTLWEEPDNLMAITQEFLQGGKILLLTHLIFLEDRISVCYAFNRETRIAVIDPEASQITRNVSGLTLNGTRLPDAVGSFGAFYVSIIAPSQLGITSLNQEIRDEALRYALSQTHSLDTPILICYRLK